MNDDIESITLSQREDDDYREHERGSSDEENEKTSGNDKESGNEKEGGNQQGSAEMGSDDEGAAGSDQELPRSVRGLPQHLRAAIRKRQNVEAARRTRARQKENHKALFERFHEQTRLIAALEDRVSALVAILENNGYTVPASTADDVCANLNAAREAAQAAVRSAAAGSDTHAGSEEAPDNEELFEEMMRILEGDENE